MTFERLSTLILMLAVLSGCGSPSESVSGSPIPPEPSRTVVAIEPTTAAQPSAPLLLTPTQTSSVEPVAPPENDDEHTQRLCVVVLGDVAREEIVEDLQAGFTHLQQRHPDWETAFGEGGAPTLGEGCEVDLPEGPLSPQQNIGPGMVATPGPWYAVIVVVAGAPAQQLLGENDVLDTSYEMVVQGGEAVEVTNSLVVRASFIESPQFRDWYLPILIRLAPLELAPPPDVGNK